MEDAFPQTFSANSQQWRKAYLDWLMWSCSSSKLFCFSCRLFHGEEGASLLTSTDDSIKDNWRKLYEQVKSHERNPVHVSRYLSWKALEALIKENKGV